AEHTGAFEVAEGPRHLLRLPRVRAQHPEEPDAEHAGRVAAACAEGARRPDRARGHEGAARAASCDGGADMGWMRGELAGDARAGSRVPFADGNVHPLR